MKFDNLLRHALRITDAYSGEKPLHLWIREFFRANPQMGSHDRKLLSEMAYCFYRPGHALKSTPAEERMLAGLFLCNEKPLELLEYFRPEWNELIGKSTEEKAGKLREKFPDFSIRQIFPWPQLLSPGVDHHLLCLSYLKKPELFIRARPGKEEKILSKLREKQIPFREWNTDDQLLFSAYSFSNGTQLRDIFEINREAVVQDLSSQKTAAFMKIPGADPLKTIRAWDACAASGGKSMLLADLYPALDLAATDIRKSILKNLRLRLTEAGISRYRAFPADLTREKDLPEQSFDLVVADLPCTGSGTWSRTPESLYFFDPRSPGIYRERQQKMLSNIIRRLKPGGQLVYITCSVFAEENEQVAEYMVADGRLQPVRREMITGYAEGADSLFAAGFKNNFTSAV